MPVLFLRLLHLSPWDYELVFFAAAAVKDAGLRVGWGEGVIFSPWVVLKKGKGWGVFSFVARRASKRSCKVWFLTSV